MEANWLIAAPTTLINWQPKVDLVAISGPVSDDCQILASNDVEAIQAWIDQVKDVATTKRAYQKEAERLLLWCAFEQGMSLAELKAVHFEQYFNFLQNPPASWLSTRGNLRAGRYTVKWRPLAAPLKQASLLFAVRVIKGLINYLVAANYLKTNPINLIKKFKNLELDPEEQKYKVWARMLEVDEWQAVQQALQSLPEADLQQQQYKNRTMLLFALLYLLGLRIHEAASITWGSFRIINGNWWLFVKGKGGKLGHVPVNDQALHFIKIYRLSLNKTPLPEEGELELLLISYKTSKPLGIRQLFADVKAIGKIAAMRFKDNPAKKHKLEQLSPHWLRHLSASHQDLVGIAGPMIQANHRHGSFTTTQIYLHAPDELRAQEMQKLQMSINPKLYATTPNSNGYTKIELGLIGSNLSGEAGLIKLIENIENQVLVDFDWEREAELASIINKYNEVNVFKQPLNLSYTIEQPITGEQLKYVKTAILRAAEIRLFKCDFKVEYYE